MSTVSISLPDDLKTKAFHLANKENMSFDALVNYWLQTAVLRDETMEWMKARLQGRNADLLIAAFGKFLEKKKPGDEPALDDIQHAMEN
jgi:predicted transcriptional regulator